eukprot:CAMPEP_0115883814 /NCGR_PEP_ID=MMETSP0287-20121206/29777_1 /TAXON_ID=412157 /ORGANISM="Chrysochromulina rotalis, Strain UIO044" /LENGTH=40 /DNA_ID= /DNA_START= /DNA_END= /DNA_ORIENTATION=
MSRLSSAPSPPHSCITSCHSGLGSPADQGLSTSGREHATG